MTNKASLLALTPLLASSLTSCAHMPHSQDIQGIVEQYKLEAANAQWQCRETAKNFDQFQLCWFEWLYESDKLQYLETITNTYLFQYNSNLQNKLWNNFYMIFKDYVGIKFEEWLEDYPNHDEASYQVLIKGLNKYLYVLFEERSIPMRPKPQKWEYSL